MQIQINFFQFEEFQTFRSESEAESSTIDLTSSESCPEDVPDLLSDRSPEFSPEKESTVYIAPTVFHPIPTFEIISDSSSDSQKRSNAMEGEGSMEVDDILDLDLGSVQRENSNKLPRFVISVSSEE